MPQRCFGGRKIYDYLGPIKLTQKIIGDQNAHFTDTGRFAGIQSKCRMALPFDGSRQPQYTGFFGQSDQPASHSASSPSNDNVDHGRELSGKDG
jgi:hypothetical protein